MVKYTCKTPTARVNETTAVREALPKRMPGVACTGQSSGSRLAPRSCSMGFNSPFPFIAGSNPAVRWKTYRQWIGFVLRDAKDACESPLSCASTIRKQSHGQWRDSTAFPSEPPKSGPARGRIPCLPDRRQKPPFRAVTGTLKPPAAAFADMTARPQTTFQEDYIL